MLQAYRDHVAERAALGIPPLPLTAKQTGELVELLKNPPAGEEATLVELITHRVPAGVDDAAKVKASYLPPWPTVPRSARSSAVRKPPSCWAPCWVDTTSHR